ncbi:MFS transporter [Amycolatopsis jiangsuensis]|uniref:MFS family permease n=1 Tax=Amycolatopsis jiangsuensis TaxID=1181879 RepID=A0A840J793_9PSEU|nr:MFS transporter [Amycolatopsis jiangsuensis]MBB4689653.1 MFS family permease [Amycolatopsis jiangsuensis]
MSECTIDVAKGIDQARFPDLQSRVLVVCTIITIIDGHDTQMIGFAVPAMAGDWGVSPQSFTAAATVGLIGLTVGGIIASAIGKRFGRRRILLASIAVFSVGTLATALATTPVELVVLRLLTTLGMGGLLPNLVAVIPEYCPARRRLMSVTIDLAGLGLGGVLVGFVAVWVLPAAGWQGMFVAGGAAGLCCGALAMVAVPDSIRFFTVIGRYDTVRELLARITGSAAAGNTDIARTS